MLNGYSIYRKMDKFDKLQQKASMDECWDRNASNKRKQMTLKYRKRVEAFVRNVRRVLSSSLDDRKH